MTALFVRKAPPIMRDLTVDIPAWGVEDAAAVLGNIGGETKGFVHLQEIKPLVKGSRGGYGWCQWTGPRRRAYEAWCEGQGLDPASDEANYGFLLHELLTSERKTIAAVGRAKTLEAKVIAFERSFERAGIPHHESRIKWARLALKAYRAEEAAPPELEPEPIERPAPPDVPGPEPVPDDDPVPVPLPPRRQPDDPGVAKPGIWHRVKRWFGWGGTTGGVGLLGYLTDPWAVAAMIFGVILILALVYLAALHLFGRERVGACVSRIVRKVVPE